MKVGFVYDDIFLAHETPWGHPERKERLISIVNALKSSPLWDQLTHIKPRKATLEELDSHFGSVGRQCAEMLVCMRTYKDIAFLACAYIAKTA